jgi:hypothetical protein
MRGGQTAFPTGQAVGSDVGTSQVENLVHRLCPSCPASDKVGSGRILAAINADRGLVHAGADAAPQERWSRGCRRADVSFWFSLRLQQCLLAPRKKNRSWLKKSPSNRPIPASTSNLAERARRPPLTGPAPPSACAMAAGPCTFPTSQCPDAAALWATSRFSPIRPRERHHKGLDRC